MALGNLVKAKKYGNEKNRRESEIKFEPHCKILLARFQKKVEKL